MGGVEWIRGLALLGAIGALVSLAPVTAASAAGQRRATSRAHAGRLDRAFGRHGRAVMIGTSRQVGRMFVASTKSGGIVVGLSGQLIALTLRGQVDRAFGFGGDGRVALQPQPGEFSLAGLAVDQQGRLVIAATLRDVDSGPELRPAAVVVERLLPNGRPDPAFGNGGTFESTFGFPTPPTVPAGPGTPLEPQYTAPAVEASGLALDAEGRPVIAGNAIAELRGCETYLMTPYRWEPTEGFIVRLTTTGQLDSSFGNAGVRREGEVSNDRFPLVDGAGRIIYSKAPLKASCPGRGEGFPSLLQSLDPSGYPRGGFDVRRSGRPLYTYATALDARMRPLLLAARPEGLEEGPLEVARVEPGGSPDRRFGNAGAHRVALPETAEVRTVGADSRNRVLLAGGFGGNFLLQRLTAAGEVDAGFGVDGKAVTRFGRRHSVVRAVTTDARGRIVVAGTVSRRSPSGVTVNDVGVARYLPGPGRR
ncbi:MAG TPA: hypothetical protein VHI77_01005 [Solirubrobacterales bacterium]|nr:hypothetical protein [Solirubrobacterales bacterium]